MAAPSKITAAIASARFDNALLDLAAAGLRTHCTGSDGLRLSDHAGLRGEAVRLCNGCRSSRCVVKPRQPAASSSEFGPGSIALECPAR
jgi:hypothetical protein